MNKISRDSILNFKYKSNIFGLSTQSAVVVDVKEEQRMGSSMCAPGTSTQGARQGCGSQVSDNRMRLQDTFRMISCKQGTFLLNENTRAGVKAEFPLN